MRHILFLAAALLFLSPISATEIGDDGLHKQPWFTITFKDVAEDIQDAKSEGKHVALLVEQRGCVYCRKLHETILSDPEVSALFQEKFTVVQYNMFGDEAIIDLDGEELPEKLAIKKWEVMFTPTMMFLPDDIPADNTANASELAIAKLPGVMGKGTVLDLLDWIDEKGYTGDEHFQKYHARKMAERAANKGTN